MATVLEEPWPLVKKMQASWSKKFQQEEDNGNNNNNIMNIGKSHLGHVKKNHINGGSATTSDSVGDKATQKMDPMTLKRYAYVTYSCEQHNNMLAS